MIFNKRRKFLELLGAATATLPMGCTFAEEFVDDFMNRHVRFPRDVWGDVSPRLYLAMGYGGGPEFLRKAPELGPISGATAYVRIDREPTLDKLPFRNIGSSLYDIILAIQFSRFDPDCNEPEGVYKHILNGSFDDSIMNLIQLIREDGRKLTLRPIPEFNSSWTPTGAYAPGNDPVDCPRVFRYLVDIFRQEIGDQILGISLNYNRQSAIVVTRDDGSRFQPWDQRDFADLYPGDDYVDINEISTYDRCLDNPVLAERKGQEWRKKPQPFAEKIRPPYEALLQFGKPIGIAEIAGLGRCGRTKLEFYEDMVRFCLNEFTRVQAITFFQHDVVESNQNSMCDELSAGEEVMRNQLDWSLSPEEQEEFAVLMQRFLLARRLGLTELPALQ